MFAYIVRRVLLGLLVILLVTMFVFLFIRLLPGDPMMVYISQQELQELTDEQLDEVRVKFGLDKPIPVQYVNWLGGVLQGELGISIFYDESVSLLIGERLPRTLYLGAISFVLSAVLGIAAGTACAIWRGRWIDTLVTFLANIGVTVPSFWLGIILIYILALQAGWLPTQGYTSPFEDFWMSTKQAIMPVICLALFSIATLTRLTRSSMLEVMQQDYIRTAWSKGLKERVIILRHSIKNGLIPVVTMLGFQVAFIVGGSVIIEQIFNIPGLGRLLTQSVLSQDFQIVQAGVLIIASTVVVVNLIVDISYGWLDPRIRYD